ncbi:unnamed protein product [Paramecium octaurelia]|uniref:Uncharacterized protein n=1 Tax=Paramecium octaurelia TaxID=43137 RepID=A0A8S1WEW4_PAROT|nr:unnamed protein product [Paramecium octaurelia]
MELKNIHDYNQCISQNQMLIILCHTDFCEYENHSELCEEIFEQQCQIQQRYKFDKKVCKNGQN